VRGTTGQDLRVYQGIPYVAPKRAKNLRVLVWLRGGGLTSGSGALYDPARLGLVVVTVNYRLGNLGFFGFPGLADGGAFGIEDQQAALRWVQRNIRAFGGDPRSVTLAGESAGAHSVCAQLASPSAADLLTAPVFPLPAYGNSVLPEDPSVAVPAGRFNHVPFLTGVTRDEGTLFGPLIFPGLTPDDYLPALTKHFGARASAVAAEYPGGVTPLASHGSEPKYLCDLVGTTGR
jgi:para-nitrobenzyl esterase